jgi:phospholipid transport system substrate-binding protein
MAKKSIMLSFRGGNIDAWSMSHSSRAGFSLRAALIRALTLGLIVTATALLPSTATYAAAIPSETFVQQNVDNGLAVLNDRRLTPQERDIRFHDILLSATDVRRIALFTLGKYAVGASDSQINNFVNAFSDFFILVFEHHLDRNTGATIEVTGSKVRAPDDVIVTARLIGPDGKPVNIAFRVRKNAAGADTVVDLQVEDVSMVLTERDEFSAYLQQHGANIDTLAAELGERAAKLRAGDSLAHR